MANNSCSAGDKQVIEELVAAYLEHKGHLPANGHCRRTPGPLVKELSEAVIALTDEYERQYRQQLEELSKNWQISEDRPQASFQEVLATIFHNGCNWGRFVTIFVFISLFLRKCQQQRLRLGADQVAEWAADSMSAGVVPWIKANGDWMGLLRFYREGEQQRTSDDDGHSLRRLLTVAGASLALIGLTSFLVNRA